MALKLHNEAPKLTLNTSKVAQGTKINLSKQNPSLRSAGFKIVWEGDDLDIHAVCKNLQGEPILDPINVQYKGRTQVVPRDWIFYMNLEQQGIVHGGDLQSSGTEETEQINVIAGSLPAHIGAIDFIVTSHVEQGNPVTFESVSALKAQLVDLESNEILYTTDLNCDKVRSQTGVVFATLVREVSSWSYTTDVKGLGVEGEGGQNVINQYYS